MPRPNQSRAVFAEENLADRIAFERERLDMSYEGLAARMTAAGCPIQASALFKIEKGNPRRRIVVDELVAFAKVFGVPVQELLLPPEIAVRSDILRLAAEYGEAQANEDAAFELWTQAGAVTRNARQEIESYVLEHPDLQTESLAALEGWTIPTWTEAQMFWIRMRLQDELQRAIAGWPEDEDREPDWDFEPDEDDLRGLRTPRADVDQLVADLKAAQAAREK